MTEKLMFSLLGSKIFGSPVEQACIDKLSEAGELSRLFELSAHHDMAHIIGAALSDIEIMGEITKEDKASLSKFENEFMKAVFRQSGIAFELQEICKALEEAKIPHIPLKGAVIRALYPEPWMRTSCDVDVFVHKEDLDAAEEKLIRKLNYKLLKRGTHDVIFSCESGVNVELHFTLVEEGKANSANEVLKDVWDSAILTEGTEYRYEMSYPMFYFYHIAHMAKHFEYGGTGIRPILDLWLLDNKCEYDPEERVALLKKGGLLTFAEYMRELSLIWFSDKELTHTFELLEEFILSGGAYGTFENRAAVQQKKKGGKLKYILYRIWLPYKVLKDMYPILKKHKWLYPFYQMRRWLGLLFSGKFFRACREFKANNQLPRGRAIVAEELLEKMELV